MRTIVWFRGKDLRLADHAPLREAARAGEVIPVFVLDPFFFAPSRARALPHRMQHLLDALAELAQSIAQRGSRLTLVEGRSVEVIPRLVAELAADRVVAQRWVEPFARERDRRIRQVLGDRFVLHGGETLLPPGSLRTRGGAPYSVFTPFSRAFAAAASIAAPLPSPRSLPPLAKGLALRSAALPTLESLGIARNNAILRGGEQPARRRLQRFLRTAAASYDARRDRMDLAGTSRLSQDLKFGTLSPRQVWTATRRALGDATAADVFLRELVWREFNYSTLWDRPELLTTPFRGDFVGFPWREDAAGLRAWANGETGYPIVDAAARQLLAEGFVHNRARMIAASFLTKHLLIDYRRGEAHYLSHLTDGDWAQNNAGWQWSAGCGCDAQPYFRIFHPVTQGARFDPDGAYVRRYLPALARVPTRYLHSPWTAPDAVLRAAGVTLGRDYPRPIVEHRFARERFLSVATGHLKRA
ncbi:MAG: deoxyribodipyrimidine photo-lyase [Nannocystaceae bacterium]|nr:deoxyribodipyrimidine photo-lyase [Myxococcales bacterium]